MKKHALISTNQQIHVLEYTGQGEQPWKEQYERVLMPATKGKHHIQFVRKSRIKTTPLSFTEAA